jgi:hypothetical protein
MPAKSKAQRRVMGMAEAYKNGDLPNASEMVMGIAKSMSKKQIQKFSRTKEKGLPKKKGKSKNYLRGLYGEEE